MGGLINSFAHNGLLPGADDMSSTSEIKRRVAERTPTHHVHVSSSRPAATAQSVRSAPAKLLGSWQLEQTIHQGVIHSLYRARPLGCPPSWPSDYVVKVLRADFADDPTAVAVMRREAEVGRHSSHPNLVPILEARLDAHPAHLVMPFLEGASLDRVMKAVGPLAVPQALWVTRQIAMAIGHLHAQGWLVGDVKPANMVVAAEGHATLIDFGAALRVGESLFDPERPWHGTLHYVAPEMLTSATQTSPASDIYSLGGSLYAMLCGQPPFPYDDAAKLVEAHRGEVPLPLDKVRPGVPESLVQLVSQMLAKTPLRRPQSADELVDRLATLEIQTLSDRLPDPAAAAGRSVDARYVDARSVDARSVDLLSTAVFSMEALSSDVGDVSPK